MHGLKAKMERWQKQQMSLVSALIFTISQSVDNWLIAPVN
jgi:hypothetical protein